MNSLNCHRYEEKINLTYRQHAVKRMHERGISEEDVEHIIANGKIIENYPNDAPYPSTLTFGMAGTKAIHVVYASDDRKGEIFIITVYEPDLKIWCDDLKTRRKS